ncbi:phosphoribosylanthranilate isomerase [soil metagenome]
MKIKVCGLTDPANALAVAWAGVDWVGLNFHPLSSRFVEIERAAEIVQALPKGVEAVGVFVDRPAEEVAETAHRVGLRIVQLHGQEPLETVLALQKEGLAVIRAFRLANEEAILEMIGYLDRADLLGVGLDAVLVDAHVPGQAGGTGHAIADHLLDSLPVLPHLILAGGLTPENVADRVARVQPWMVDVAGGVESAPGWKDPQRVLDFVQAARESVPPVDIPGINSG